MKEKAKFRISKTLLVLAAVSLLIATTEGILFYGNNQDSPYFFRLLLIIQNSINAFAFKPTISLSNAIAFMNEKNNILYTVVGYAYGVAIFTAPYCTLTFMYKALEHLLKIFVGIGMGKKGEHIIIFGFNDDVRSLLENAVQNKAKNRCIHIVSETELSSEEAYSMSRSGYKYHKMNLFKTDKKDIPYLLKKLHTERSKNIILFEDSSIKNFSLLQMFSLKKGDGLFELGRGTKVTCRCEENGISEMISDYYHVDSGAYGYDLELVSIPELQIRTMFEQTPLHTFYKNSDTPVSQWNTRILLAGFGRLGHQAVLQAMNLAVVSPENSISIDIYDEEAEKKLGLFSMQLDPDSFEFTSTSIKMKKGVADGSFEINCFKTDVRSHDFRDTVKVRNDKAPYTYALVAIDEIDTGTGCAIQLGRLFDQGGNPDVPVVIRMDSDRRLAEYIQADSSVFRTVSLITERAKAITIENIINKDMNARSKELNYLYSNMEILKKGQQPSGKMKDKESLWSRLSMFKRESNKAHTAHDTVEDDMLAAKAKELNIASVSKKIDELVGSSGKLMMNTGNAWYLYGSDEEFVKALKADAFAFYAAASEHRRWCYFVVSKGWRPGQRNDRLKIHNCLTTFAGLENDPKTLSTVKYDIMPLIIRLAAEHHHLER